MGQGSTRMLVNRAGHGGRTASVLRRFGAMLIIALNILGVLLSLAGIVAVWRVKATLTDGGTTNLARLESALGAASIGLQTVDAGLDAADAEQITSAGRTIAAIPDIVVSLNATLDAANQIPFISVPTIDSAQVERVGERMTTLAAAITSARQRRTETIGPTTVDQDLQALRASAADLDAQVRAAQVRVTAARTNWPRWIERATFALTLLLLWLALAQAGFARLAWGHWRLAAR